MRDEAPIGPKAPDERRIVVLGDSLVLSVQVPFEQTFCHLLEVELNRARVGGVRWRVINAGVQGYGVVDEYLLFRHVAEAFEPDLVLIAAFPGNAASAADKAAWLDNDGPTVGARCRDRIERAPDRALEHGAAAGAAALRPVARAAAGADAGAAARVVPQDAHRRNCCAVWMSPSEPPA